MHLAGPRVSIMPCVSPEAALQEHRVEFLIAGVQKGGTTALFDYLVEHPSLDLPAIKEAHFFDDERGVDWAADLIPNLTNLADRPESAAPARLDTHPTLEILP